MGKKLLIFGFGYTAAELVRQLKPDQWTVTGTTRNDEKLKDMPPLGVNLLVWPGTDMGSAIQSATHLLISAAPNQEGDPVLKELRDEISNSTFEWVGYLSTTGVYGDHGGGWVDESTLLTPSTKRGHLRCDAERAWQALAQSGGLPLHIFRLAGIYGPGRGPFAKVWAGTARRIVKHGQVFSRIHVADIAAVLKASMDHPNPGAIYNVCDDDPAPPQDVIGYAAQLLGLPIPAEEDFAMAEMTQMARSFYAESKRVRNDLIKTELGISLQYPSYQIGLDALFSRE